MKGYLIMDMIYSVIIVISGIAGFLFLVFWAIRSANIRDHNATQGVLHTEMARRLFAHALETDMPHVDYIHAQNILRETYNEGLIGKNPPAMPLQPEEPPKVDNSESPTILNNHETIITDPRGQANPQGQKSKGKKPNRPTRKRVGSAG